MIAFIITYTCQLLQLMSYKIDVQNFSYKFKNTLVLQNCTFCFKQGLWCMEFYSPFQGISLVYQQKIVNIKTLFILIMLLKRNINFNFFFLILFFSTWNFLIPNQIGNLWPPIKIKKNSKYVWKFSWMLNHVELNAVLSETLVYAYFVLMGLD